jgi:NAD(P)-dependent dehydrogenase (short-subunit alcohol dehydrogenase family)
MALPKLASLSTSDSNKPDPVALPLAGEIALVTGSGRGLGNIIARKLMALGADIILHDINEEAPARFGEVESLSALAHSMSGQTSRVVAVTGDISDASAIESMVASAREKLGEISILVNCAGGDIGADGNKPSPATPTNFKLEDLYAVLDRNLIGTMLVCREIAPRMMANKKGSIINIASVLAHYGAPIEISYGCAKAAIVHYTRSLAAELRDCGVRANVVSPGPTMTARFLATRETDPKMRESGSSLIRYAKPEEIADAISFFAGNESRYVTGQVLLIDGGENIFAA